MTLKGLPGTKVSPNRTSTLCSPTSVGTNDTSYFPSTSLISAGMVDVGPWTATASGAVCEPDDDT